MLKFFNWCEMRGLQLEPIIIAAYIEQHRGSKPTVKQHLAAIRMLFDFLVINQVVPFNPAASVRGPKYVIKRGKTPVLAAEDMRQLLEPPRTTKLYDRTSDEITLDEIESIAIEPLLDDQPSAGVGLMAIKALCIKIEQHSIFMPSSASKSQRPQPHQYLRKAL